jgi:hypothetical protein
MTILIGTPCYNGLVTAEYLTSMLGLQREFARRGIGFSLETTTTVSLIPVARNFIVSRMLESDAFSHLLFIDADLSFDPAQVLRFLEADKDIVAGIYPVKHLDLEAVRRLPPGGKAESTFHYAVTLCAGEQPTPAGFIRAEYAATGFMLIRRQVLQQMAERYPELKYDHMFAHQGTALQPKNNHLYALFDTSLDRSQGLYLPEDYTFCKRWRAIGGEIWVDVLSKFKHVGPYAYEGDFSVFVQRSETSSPWANKTKI